MNNFVDDLGGILTLVIGTVVVVIVASIAIKISPETEEVVMGILRNYIIAIGLIGVAGAVGLIIYIRNVLE